MRIAVVLLGIVVLCGFAAAEPFPGDRPGSDIGGGLPANFEPSGAVWHPALAQLFVVNDNGQLARIEADGGFPTVWTVWTVGGDLEAVCVADETSNFVYIGLEQPDAILEFDVVCGTLTRAFNLSAVMTGPSNRGLEALTFVPDPTHKEGGLFHAGLQEDGKVYVFELPIRSSATSTTTKHVSTWTPVAGRTDLSGLHYDRDGDRLYALFDSTNRISQLTRDGVFITEWTAPGADQEGVALRGCELFIAQDDGPVMKYTSFPDAATCQPLCASTSRVSLTTGGTVEFDLRIAGGVPAASLYLLAGSSSGASPGIHAGSMFLPLNPDAYFNFTILFANAGPFLGTRGQFGATGRESARLVVPTGLSPSLTGLTLHHAFMAADPGTHVLKAASNAERLLLIP